ncbi:MAG: VanZ family protein [Treponema sp.]|jgi:VanZ family protein|nr:VanZ family protein [Treponema sp.]
MMAPYPVLITKLPALLTGTAIWLLSSQSTLPQPKGILGFDKFQHLAAYMVFTWTAGLWFSPDQWRRRPLAVPLLTAGIGSLYGLIDEIHQSFVPGRDCNGWDWIADTLGALLGSGARCLILWRQGRFHER